MGVGGCQRMPFLRLPPPKFDTGRVFRRGRRIESSATVNPAPSAKPPVHPAQSGGHNEYRCRPASRRGTPGFHLSWERPTASQGTICSSASGRRESPTRIRRSDHRGRPNDAQPPPIRCAERRRESDAERQRCRSHRIADRAMPPAGAAQVKPEPARIPGGSALSGDVQQGAFGVDPKIAAPVGAVGQHPGRAPIAAPKVETDAEGRNSLSHSQHPGWGRGGGFRQRGRRSSGELPVKVEQAICRFGKHKAIIRFMDEHTLPIRGLMSPSPA